MRLESIKNAEERERYFSILSKQLTQPFRKRCDSTPVFVLGTQRSGTSMMMRAFHRHPDTLVYDEHRDSVAFSDYRLRSLDCVKKLVDQARYPTICYKPICDSHLITEMHRKFPEAHFIWAYRDYRDVANSSLRKFEHATRAIRLVCTNQPGGGWFREGVSSRVSEVLRSVFRTSALSEFDLACLIWWARNQIILDSGLTDAPNVTLVKYEALVTQPSMMLKWLFYRIRLPYRERVCRNISPRSIGRHPAPSVDNCVDKLCIASLATLDAAFLAGNPPGQ
jgi:hypothetical protein